MVIDEVDRVSDINGTCGMFIVGGGGLFDTLGGGSRDDSLIAGGDVGTNNRVESSVLFPTWE